MIRNVLTWDGNNIQDATYETSLVIEGDAVGGVDVVWGERPGARPRIADIRLSGRYLPLLIRLKGAATNYHANYSTLKRWFDVEKRTPRRLVIADAAAGNKQWYVDALPVAVDPNGDGVRINLALDQPYWQSVTETQVSQSVTSSAPTQTWSTVAPGGNRNTRPRIRVTPTSAKASSYVNAVFIAVRNPGARACINYPYDLTNAAWNTAALVTAGKMQADGDDLRPWVDGVEVDRWLSGINGASTKVWININLSAPQQTTLGTAIASSGTLTVVQAVGDISGFPVAGQFLIGTEMFTYTEKDDTARQFRGSITRAAKNTSMAAHAVGDAVHWIEHDIWIRYGNSSATAPATNNMKKPIIDLAASTNSSWVYAEFGDTYGFQHSGVFGRPAMGGAVVATTANHSGSSYPNPATDMGIKDNGRTSGDSGVVDELAWLLSHPVGFTNWNFTNGEKYRPQTKWFRTCCLTASDGEGGATLVQYNIATPTAAASWEAWSDNRALGGTYHTLQFFADYSSSTIRSSGTAVEVADLTLTLASANVPVSTICAELTGQYTLTATLTNQTSGESISFNFSMELNQTIEIDCEAMTAVYLKDNSNAFAGLTRSSKRSYFLDLSPGANTLNYSETGVAGVTVAVYYRDRETV